MTARNSIYTVSITARRVAVTRVKRGQPGFRKAKKSAVMRQRDAIELFRKLKANRRRFDGSYGFDFLDTAKTFAMLCLRAQASAIEDDLDAVLAYDGKAKQSGD